MGCWGITAFESDKGLDTVITIREILQTNEKNTLDDWMQALKSDKHECPPPLEDAVSHSSYMALAEVVMSYLDNQFTVLDYDEEDTWFSEIASLTASKSALQELRDYLAGTLDTCREWAEDQDEHGRYYNKWNGWVEEKNWIGWQEHMEKLIFRLDKLICSPEEEVNIYQNAHAHIKGKGNAQSAKETAYFTELAIQLRQNGFTLGEPDSNGLLTVEQDGDVLCKATSEGGTRYWPDLRIHPVMSQVLEQVMDIVKTTYEYMNLLENAPPLKASGLNDRYKLLAGINNTVLAGTLTELGAQFVTWEWDYDHTGVGTGHYFEGETGYKAAKRDFAVRSELVPRKALFTPEQLTDLYECVSAMKRSCGDGTYDFEKRMEKLMGQIEELVPGVQKHGILEPNTPMTVREFLTQHPKDTVSMMTPNGYCCLTPDTAKRALEGENVITSPGTSDCCSEEEASILLDEVILSGSLSKGVWNLLTDYPGQQMEESQGQQMGGMTQMQG